METLNNNQSKRYFTIGTILLTIGIISIINNAGIPMPHWIWSWHTIMLTIGLWLGYKKDFVAGGWILLVIFGALFTLNSVLIYFLSPFMPALVLITVGLYILLKPAKSTKDIGK
ncbi:LiaF transmembrane domain-containing protein [Pedobacter sp.]|uniref:LiaF transmembrane domain-containing protein n=1 Tax=Pedobacter sp. TaxID=1411316 RepID=UPI003D7F7303